MNDAARRLLAAGRDGELTGMPLQKVVRVAAAVDAFEQVVEAGGTASGEAEVEIAGEPRNLDIQAVRVEGASRAGIDVVLVARDVTELSRMASMRADFAANASHELRTPLATIRAAVDSLMSLGADDREVFRKFVGILDRHTERLENMTHDLLDLHLIESSRRPVQLSLIDAGELARWVSERFAGEAREKGVKLEAAADESLKTFTSDETLLKLIIQNLVDNAIKFTPAGGRVECSLARRDDGILLRVGDTGIGIPQELHERVFERFYQVETSRSGDARTRGTGLGLAIVKHASERLSAKVELDSAPGEGTRVDVLLPRQSRPGL